MPVAEAVADGVPLYVGAAGDNKPPLFELLNLVVHWTGLYEPLFMVLVGFANGATAILLWHRYRRSGPVGPLAAALFVLSVPLVNGWAINVRSFCVLFLVAALVVHGPVVTGALAGASLLFSQHVVFSIPVVLYRSATHRDVRSSRHVATALTAMAVTVSTCYLVVLQLWGWESLTASVHWTVGVAERYVFGIGPSLFTTRSEWVRLHLLTAVKLVVPLSFGSIGTVHLVRNRLDGEHGRRMSTALLLAVSAVPPLLVRPIPTYWLYPLPWICVLAALGVMRTWAEFEPVGG